MESAESLLEMQRKVQMAIGRCLLNYQLIEQQLKDIIALSSVEIKKNGIGQFKATSPNRKNNTFGQLFGKFFSDVALTKVSASKKDRNIEYAEPKGLSSSFKFRQLFDNHTLHAAFKNKTEKLVKNRNFLVHHFLEMHSLNSVESCEDAMKYLESKNAFIHEQYEYFNNLLIQIENSKKLHEEFIKCREFREALQTALLDLNPNKLH